MKHACRYLLCPALAAILLCSQGCASLTPWSRSEETAMTEEGGKKPLPFSKFHEIPKANVLEETPLQVEKNTKDEADDQLTGKGRRPMVAPNRTHSTMPETIASAYPSAQLQGITDPEEELLFEINFDNAQISEIAAAFAAKEVLNFNYLIDPTVKGAVTVNIKTKMKAKEVWGTFQHLLWLSGAYASPSNGFINILPFEKMAKEQKLFAKHEPQPNVDVLYLPIRYQKSATVLDLIRPFLTDGASASDITDANALLIVETPANAEKIQELIRMIDNKGEQEWPVRCYTCHEVQSDTIAQEMLCLLPVLGMPVAAAKGPSNGAIKITSIPRLGAIVVSASLEEVLDEVVNWLKLLDREDTEDRTDIFFYNVKHSTVDKVSTALEAFFNTTITMSPTTAGTRSTTSAGSLSVNSRSRSRSNTIRNNTTTASNRSRTTANNRQQANTQANSLHQTIFETDVIVYADDESNRLTVKTTPRAWKLVRAFLERQDVPPRQVSIHAIITNITLSKNNEFGITYAMSRSVNNGQDLLSGMLGMSMPNTTVTAASTIPELMGNTGTGLLFQGNGSSHSLAFLKAVAGKGNTRILSEPHILVVSGATAKVNVGQKLAIPTESTNYSDKDTMRSNYEYTDTGVIMEVTPYITAGNEVRMVISQEISAAEQASDPAIPPVINTKTLSSELVVPDNSTLIMGGMIQNEKHKSISGIPFLMDLPYLGWLFRYNSITDARTEMLILLTVNVVDTHNPQEELVRRYKASLEAIEEAAKKNATY